MVDNACKPLNPIHRHSMPDSTAPMDCRGIPDQFHGRRRNKRAINCCNSRRPSKDVLIDLTCDTPQPSKKKKVTLQSDAQCSLTASPVIDFLAYLRLKEAESQLLPENLENDNTQRRYVVEWLDRLVDVSGLLPDTLFLAVTYMDCFLSSNTLGCPQHELPLLGLSSLIVAAKFAENRPINSLQSFISRTGNLFTKEELIKMERQLLKALKYELRKPTILTFLEEYKANSSTDRAGCAYSMADKLAKLCLLDHRCCIQVLTSKVAASVLFVVRSMMSHMLNDSWTSEFQIQTGYKPSELKDCVTVIKDLYRKSYFS